MSDLLLVRTGVAGAGRAFPRPPSARVLQLRGNLRASMGDGIACSLMVGFGETYLPAFVLALGMGEIASGLVVTVPMLAGAVLQLVGPWGIAQVDSHRRWVIACSLCQAASLLFLPIACGGNSWLVFLAATFYWAAGLGAGPAWNTWIETIVPKLIRARFFATRVRACQATLLAGFLVGGTLLQYSSHSPAALVAFQWFFVAAALARAVSAAFLTLHREQPATFEICQPGRSLLSMRALRENQFISRLLTYFLATQAAVYLSGPFFTPFMLSKLQLSYAQYTALIAIAYAGKVSTLAAWGRYAQRAGAYRLLWIGGLGIVPVSAAWLISNSIWYLAGVQFLGGVAWAAYELAMFLLFFDAIPRSQRTGLLTLYNLGNSLAMVAGGLVGALYLRWFGDSAATYLSLFACSSLARLGAIGLLARVRAPWRQPPLTATRTEALRPASGSIEQPILSIAHGQDG